MIDSFVDVCVWNVRVCRVLSIYVWASSAATPTKRSLSKLNLIDLAGAASAPCAVGCCEWLKPHVAMALCVCGV